MQLTLKLRCLLIASVINIVFSTAAAEDWEMPINKTPRPQTTTGIPHIQIGVDPVPELSQQLADRVAKISGVELQNTNVGRAGSTGFWVSDSVAITRTESTIRGREFAHCHPDGSLHASLPKELASQAVEAGWAIHHPWASKKPGLQGFVMIYTPTTSEELDVVFRLVEESYRFVTTP